MTPLEPGRAAAGPSLLRTREAAELLAIGESGVRRRVSSGAPHNDDGPVATRPIASTPAAGIGANDTP